MAPAAEVPDMTIVAVLAGEKKFGVDAILDHVGPARLLVTMVSKPRCHQMS